MHYARLHGQRVKASDISLAEARKSTFICHECEVPVDAVAMPGLDRTPEWKRRRPGFSELYFRVAKPNKHGNCPFAPIYVDAVIDEVVIESRMGDTSAPPSSIRLMPPEAAVTAAIFVDEDGQGARRPRYVDRWGDVRQRGDRATVVAGIEPACRAYLEIAGIRQRPLSIDMLSENKTYGDLFVWIRDFEEPLPRIWVGTPMFQQMPAYGAELMTVHLFDGQVVVDRRSWSPRRVKQFDIDLEISLTWMRDRWRPERSAWRARCFAFGKCSPARQVVVSDPRAFALLIDAQPLRQPVPSGRSRRAAPSPS